MAHAAVAEVAKWCLAAAGGLAEALPPLGSYVEAALRTVPSGHARAARRSCP